jgi:hypothetical protein
MGNACAADPGPFAAVIDLTQQKPRRLSMRDEISGSAVSLLAFARSSRPHNIAVMFFAL